MNTWRSFTLAPLILGYFQPTLSHATQEGILEHRVLTADSPIFASPVPTGPAIFFANDQRGTTRAEVLAAPHLLRLKVQHGMGPQDSFRVTRSRIDELGMAHIRVQQKVEGVPVFGGEAIIHLKQDGNLYVVTDSVVDHLRVNSHPEVEADEAAEIAIGLLEVGDRLDAEPQVDLWALRHEGEDHLVWRVTMPLIYGDHPTNPVVFIDAHSGEEVWSYENLQTGYAISTGGNADYYGWVPMDVYTPDGAGVYTEDIYQHYQTQSMANTTSSAYWFVEPVSDPDFDSVSPNEGSLVAVHYGADLTFNYFQYTMGRAGINGAWGPGTVGSLTGSGAVPLLLSDYGSGYTNAAWSTTSGLALFGDGNGSSWGPMTAIDIVAHELTHGVTQYEANLTYSGESGALNEATSDFHGVMIEANAQGGGIDWKMGEDSYWAGDAARYMYNPAADGWSRDHYYNYVSNDDVHRGSGIANLAFYLASSGGSHPAGYLGWVGGIGGTNAAKIWYITVRDYLTSSSSYWDAWVNAGLAAKAMFGAGSAQERAYWNAFADVGVGVEYPGSENCMGYREKASQAVYNGITNSWPSANGFYSSTGRFRLGTEGTGGSGSYKYKVQKKLSDGTWSDVTGWATGMVGVDQYATYQFTAAKTYRVRIQWNSGSGTQYYDLCVIR